MSAFNFRALDASGREHKGMLSGESIQHVRSQLFERGLTPTDIKEINQVNLKTRFVFWQQNKISREQVAMISRQLATLLQAGLPLAEALATVIKQSDQLKTKNILQAVRAKVLEGHSLNQALEEFKLSFPDLYRASVAAGEQTGHLDTVMLHLADYLERQQVVQQKVSQALIYPSFMTCVSFAVITFLLTSIVPKMAGVFTETGQALPLATQWLIGISEIVSNYGIYALVGLVIILFGFQQALQQPKWKLKWHQILLHVPFLRKPIQVLNTARYASSFGMLLAASVPVLEAMHMAANTIKNKVIRDDLISAISKVREGGTIHRALDETHHFPAVSIHLIASGESAGQLEAMLERAAAQQEAQMMRLIETLLSMFEPILIILMGLVVLFIVLAVLLPIFSMSQLVG